MTPLEVFERIGILPYLSVSHQSYVTASYAEPAVFGPQQPASIHPADSWTRSAAGDSAMAEIVVVDSGLATRQGDMFDSTGHLLPGASRKYRPTRKRAMLSRPYRFGASVARVPGEVAALTAHGQDWYFHWLFDVLPRIAMLERAGIRPDRFYLQCQHRFQRESLSLLGLDAARLIECDQVPILAAEHLVVPCHAIGNGREFPEWLGTWLRTQLMEPVLQAAAAATPERIYVSRARTRHRRVTNEGEVVDLLRERGFVPVELEDLSFPEQIRLFHGLRAVVSPHGAGLANLVFCSKGAQVVELFPDATIDLYFRLSCAAGLDYAYMKGNGGVAKLGKEDFAIDLGSLRKTLDLVGL